MNRPILYLSLVGLFWCGTVAALSSDLPVELLTNQVVSQLAVDRSQVSLTLLEAPNLAGPPSAYRFEFGSIPRGRTLVRGLSTEYHDITFTIDVRVWDSAWVTASRVERGTELSPEQFSRSWQDVTDAAPWKGGKLEGVRAKRSLPPGTLLLTDAVEPLPLVARGSAVTLQAKAGHLKVSRQGVALADAALGETVRVRVDRNTVILATAAGADLCVVGF